ncbi:MAG: radical SAM protein, partial [Spirochaetaceae bacterium]|nr:radical SAM protein [Spirochaetaceae bacterium]
TLDDGEQPLLSLCEFLVKTKKKTDLKRTFIAGEKGNVEYMDCMDTEDICHRDLPAPDYSTLMDQPYLSLLPVTNKMHRLWSEGKWNKMTLAHGCYWHRCAFCDTSLDYIKRYEPSDACTIVDKIEKLIEETGNRAFHFVDEAAPPALLKKMAIELIVRNISISWWTNIRFEKSFTPDLCRLLAKSGCIAISGGLEVASDRLLSRIDKGVSVKQVSSVAAAFSSSGIMVHTYLMYGFPGQSEQEIIDALENVRQMFEARLIDSAFWHQFALTAHSPAGLNPDSYGIEITGPAEGSFARNDLYFNDTVQYDPSDYSQGLRSALSAFMSGRELKRSVNRWFAFKTPRPTVKRNFIKTVIKEMRKSLHIHNHSRFIWTGAELRYREGFIELQDTDGAQLIKADKNMWNFLSELLKICNIKDHRIITTVQVELLCGKYSIDLDSLLSSELFSVISAYGLLII